MPEKKLIKFVTELLNLKIYYFENNKWVQCSYNISMTDYGIRIEANEFIMLDANSYKIKLEYILPMSIHNNSFFVILPEPTKSPKIRFCYENNCMHNVTYYSFFSVDKRNNPDYIEKSRSNELSVNIDRWALPMSGIIFTWTLQRTE